MSPIEGLALKKAVLFADRIKDLGYAMATKAGLSISIDYLVIPEKKTEILREAERRIAELWEQYQDGLITESERYNKAIDIWSTTTERITDEMMKRMETGEYIGPNGEKVMGPSFNPVYIMAFSEPVVQRTRLDSLLV